MFIACAIVVAALMEAVLLASAGATFTRPKRYVDQMSTLGLTPYFKGAPLAGVLIGLRAATLRLPADT